MNMFFLVFLSLVSLCYSREVNLPSGRGNTSLYRHSSGPRPGLPEFNERIPESSNDNRWTQPAVNDFSRPQPPPKHGKNLQLAERIICMVVDVVADPENFDWSHPDVDERGRMGTVLSSGKVFNPRIG